MGQIPSGMRFSPYWGIVHRIWNRKISFWPRWDCQSYRLWDRSSLCRDKSDSDQLNARFRSLFVPEQARGSKATVQSDIYAMGLSSMRCWQVIFLWRWDSAVTIALQHFQNPLPSVIAEKSICTSGFRKCCYQGNCQRNWQIATKSVAEMYVIYLVVCLIIVVMNQS